MAETGNQRDLTKGEKTKYRLARAMKECMKTTSVGYQIDSWEEVMPNKQSADGRFTGPADIARKWTPYEISIVSVPADPTVGVGRELEEETEQGTQSRSTDWFERQLQINKNIINQGGNRR